MSKGSPDLVVQGNADDKQKEVVVSLLIRTYSDSRMSRNTSDPYSWNGIRTRTEF